MSLEVGAFHTKDHPLNSPTPSTFDELGEVFLGAKMSENNVKYIKNYVKFGKKLQIRRGENYVRFRRKLRKIWKKIT